MKTRQQSFFDQSNQVVNKRKYGRIVGRSTHGGEKSLGLRKEERPLSKSCPIHLILKSKKAYGNLSFFSPKNKAWLENLIRSKAKKFFVSIDDFVNMGNHLHLKIRIQDRQSFQQFLKSIVNLIARKLTGARKGHKFGRFWDGLAYTRILRSEFERLQLSGYFQANRIQKQRGLKEREKFLTSLNQKLRRLKSGEIQFTEVFSTA